MEMLSKYRRSIVCLALLAIASASVGCGGVNPNTKPQAAIASYGANVLELVRQGQESAIALNKAQPTVFTDARTRSVLDGILKTADACQKLHDALVAYDAATSLDFKAQKETEVRALVDQVVALAGAAFKVDVPQPLADQFSAVYLNTLKVIDALRTELEKMKR